MEYDPVKEFNELSAEYLRLRENAFDNAAQLKFLTQKLQPLHTRRILELGCGGGKPVLKHFYDQGATVSGIDFSSEMLANARVNLPGSKLIQKDICKISLPMNYFDAILSFYVIFTLSVEDQFNLFAKIFKALKPGGLLYGTLFSKAATGSKEFSGFLQFMNHRFYYAHTTPEKYYQELEAIGFVNIDIEEKQIGSETCLWLYAQKANELLYSF